MTKAQGIILEAVGFILLLEWGLAMSIAIYQTDYHKRMAIILYGCFHLALSFIIKTIKDTLEAARNVTGESTEIPAPNEEELPNLENPPKAR